MEFFERAHVTRKDVSKREKKSDEVVKKQLKQMLHAYKTGNNQEVNSYAETENKIYDIDDVKSVSDFSDISFPKEADTTQGTVSSLASEELQSSTGHTTSYNEHNSSNSEGSESESTEDSLESITEYVEEFKSLSSSQDISTTDKDLSSTFDSSILTDDYSDYSNMSIPSSLQKSSGTENDISDDETFDPDGALANKILEKLGKLPAQNKKKLTKKNKVPESQSSKKKKKLAEEEAKECVLKNVVTQEKKSKKKACKNEDISKAYRVLDTKDEVDLISRDRESKMSDNSFHEDVNLDDSLSSSNSSQFISVSASDMQSQSLSDIVGEYIHPTVRNLPSEKQNIVHSQSCKYAILDEIMSVDNVEEVSSLVPEIDEELAMEDLTIDTDACEMLEESTVQDETVQTEDYFVHEYSADEIELTSIPIKVYNGRDNYIFVMKHSAELFVHGKVIVTAIGGSVEVFGYTLQDESINLYAPYCYFAHSIKTVQNSSAFHGLFSRLTSAGLTGMEAEEIIRTVGEHDAVISLSKINCPKIDFVDNNFTATELFSKRGDHTPKFLKKVAEKLGCSLYLDHPKRFFEEKSSWEQLVMCGLNVQSKGIICGGKSTGKSTLLRYYINRLLSKGPVLVIDLDPGQAEFTLPGNISITVVDKPLIGPNFTHLRKPERTLNIGMINPMDNTTRYISAVKELVFYCHSNEKYHSMPWIVNTMGMCNHMGLKFITYIILQIQPTFVYQIDSKVAKKRFECELTPHNVRNLYEEYMKDWLFSNLKDSYSLDYTFILGLNDESFSPQKGNSSFVLSPKDERYLNVLAYFGELLNVYGKNILEIVPFEVNIRDLNIGVNVKIPEEALTKVINGKIIALCQLKAADKRKMFTLADNALLSHGYGLIRGIDFEKGLLYILTPVPLEELNLVDTLVYADWMPELRVQEKELPDGTVVPYRTATAYHQRRLMFPPRRRYNPLQLLKVTRTS